MLARLKAWLIARRFRKATEPYDRAIAEAQAKHLPVRHLQEAKQAAVHGWLGGARA